MSTELLAESPLYREWIEAAEAQGYARGIARGYTPGFARGFAQGYARGFVCGFAEGMRTGALRVLESRFGAIDAMLIQAINQADQAVLDVLISHIAIDTLAQLQQLMGVLEQ